MNAHLPFARGAGLALLVGALTGSLVYAQVEPSPVPVETVTLDVFNVTSERDDGYRSSNSMGGFRINVPIRDLPMNIEVLTEEFLKDFAVDDLPQALEYAAGVSVFSIETEIRDEYSIRGLRSSRPKRNGYQRYYISDMTNVQRVEVIKGPASTTYGVAEPGGTINYVTKRPKATPEYELRASFGSNNYRRVQAGATGPLGDSGKLLYRLDASYLDTEGTQDFKFTERTVIAPQVVWHPFAGTRLTFDFEAILHESNPGSRAILWSPEDVQAWLDRPDGTGAGQRYNNSVLRGVPPAPAPQWTAIADYAPDSLNVQGPDAFTNYDIFGYTAEWQQRLTDNLVMRVVGSMSEANQDILRGAPNRTRVTGDGIMKRPNRIKRDNDIANAQVDFIYDFELAGMKHKILTGVEYFQDDFRFWHRNAAVAPIIYFTDDATLRPTNGTDILVNDFRNYGPATPPESFTILASLQKTERSTRSIYLNDQVTFWDDRVKVLAGVRYDESKQRSYLLTQGDGTGFRDDPLVKETSPQGGINFNLTKDIVLFGNYSESYVPSAGTLRNFDGSVSSKPPETGKGEEAGLKFDFRDGRISGTFSWFDTRKVNVIGAAFREDGTRYDVLITGQRSSGIDLGTIFNVTDSWQVKLSYARIDAETALTNGPTGNAVNDAYNQAIQGVAKHNFNAATRYSFRSGPLKGLTVGASVIHQGDGRKGTNQLADFLYLDGFTRIDAFVNYGFRMGELPTNVGINLGNLTDERYYNTGPVLAESFNVRVNFGLRF